MTRFTMTAVRGYTHNAGARAESMRCFMFEMLDCYPHNAGARIECSIRYALTGDAGRLDNVRADRGSDVLTYQVKSARATVAHGTDLRAYLASDASAEYIYGTQDGRAYVMDRETYISFCERFGAITRDSAKNGGGEKIRLGHETKALLRWLEERVR